jgi:transposase InsO family protein
MRVLGVMGRQCKRKCYTTNSKHSLGYSTNLLQQDFYVNEANQVWVGDITYIRVQHRWMCNPPIFSIT